MGRPLKDVTVCTQPGNFWCITDKDGFYTIQNIPFGKYKVRAFYQDFDGKETEIEIGEKPGRWDFTFGREKQIGQIYNPGFEEHGPEPGYTPGWKKYGTIDGILEQGKTIFAHVKAHSGIRFLHSGAGSNTKNGGVYQVVGVKQNKKYRLSAWIQTAQVGGEKGDTATRIGIDPRGDEDPYSRGIIWSSYETSEGDWKQIWVEAVAEQPVITIFLEFKQLQGNTWNANWLDDVELKEVN